MLAGTPEQLYEIAEKAPDKQPALAVDLTATFTFLGDIPAAPPRELIKVLIPAEGVVVTGGQASAGKTFVQVCNSKLWTKNIGAILASGLAMSSLILSRHRSQ
jgi:hypothetical protein